MLRRIDMGKVKTLRKRLSGDGRFCAADEIRRKNGHHEAGKFVYVQKGRNKLRKVEGIGHHEAGESVYIQKRRSKLRKVEGIGYQRGKRRGICPK